MAQAWDDIQTMPEAREVKKQIDSGARFCVWRLGSLAFAKRDIDFVLGWRRLVWRFYWLDQSFWTNPEKTKEGVKQLFEHIRKG